MTAWAPLLPLDPPLGPVPAPTRAEQSDALQEILGGAGTLDEAEIEGAATAAREHARVPPVDHPDPRKLARAHRITLRERVGLHVPGVWVPTARAIVYRPEPDARARGFVIYHELAHALAPDHATHADVARLALALLCPRAVVLARLRRAPPAAVVRWLCDRQRHAPHVFLRLRVERVLVATKHA